MSQQQFDPADFDLATFDAINADIMDLDQFDPNLVDDGTINATVADGATANVDPTKWQVAPDDQLDPQDAPQPQDLEHDVNQADQEDTGHGYDIRHAKRDYPSIGSQAMPGPVDAHAHVSMNFWKPNSDPVGNFGSQSVSYDLSDPNRLTIGQYHNLQIPQGLPTIMEESDEPDETPNARGSAGAITPPAPVVVRRPILQHGFVPQVPLQNHAASAVAPVNPSLLFANHAEAQQAAANRIVPHDWQALQNDETIPEDQADRARYVRQLRDAFVDLNECIDSEDVDSFQDRWETIGRDNAVYTEEQIETICWKLVAIAEALHTEGPGSLRIFDELKMRTVYMSRNFTFAERIRHICELMRVSKARCEKLLKFESLEMSVATPVQMISQTKINKKANDERKGRIEKVRNEPTGKMAVHRDSDGGNGIHGDSDELQRTLVQNPPLGHLNSQFSATANEQNSLGTPVSQVDGLSGPPGSHGYMAESDSAMASLMRRREAALRAQQPTPLANNPVAANQQLQPSTSTPAHGQNRPSDSPEDPKSFILSSYKRKK